MALPKDVDYTEAQKVLAESSRKFSEGYADYTRMNGGMPQLIDYYTKLVNNSRLNLWTTHSCQARC